MWLQFWIPEHENGLPHLMQYLVQGPSFSSVSAIAHIPSRFPRRIRCRVTSETFTRPSVSIGGRPMLRHPVRCISKAFFLRRHRLYKQCDPPIASSTHCFRYLCRLVALLYGFPSLV
ncbi:hypothetical protein EVAR_94709_1 [Eumeta japonica]|uniref:Uncharacterized protein n=1 Tax=Eumeta variegata TaxID=151549 RepID=A0A4C1UW67_EUMVA|nr:hypothetical protein EVAR_94709_1 [Eumeta japonica]